MSSIRTEVIRIAREEATPVPNGKVSDLVVNAEGKRAGWERLKSYFDEAVSGWTPQKWIGRDKIRLPSGTEVMVTGLEGIQKPGFRVPQGPSKPSGISWCGIFASWVYLKAGITDAKWVMSSGIVSKSVEMISVPDGVKEGDVIVLKPGKNLKPGELPEVHHAIVVEMPSIYDGGDTSIITVNGNSRNQSVELHSRFSTKDIWYYYRIKD